MISPAKAVTALLRSDTALMALVNDKVYAFAAPAKVTSPFVVVSNLSSQPLVRGVHQLQVATVLIDVVGTAGVTGSCDDIANAVIEALATVSGPIEGVAFAGFDVVGSAFSYDPSDSPAVPRWVLTVTGTVRKV